MSASKEERLKAFYAELLALYARQQLERDAFYSRQMREWNVLLARIQVAEEGLRVEEEP